VGWPSAGVGKISHFRGPHIFGGPMGKTAENIFGDQDGSVAQAGKIAENKFVFGSPGLNF
jgi:hypothetical protein